MSPASSRIIAYLALLFLPLLAMAVFHPPNQDTLLYNLGRCFGLLGFALLIGQVILATRLKSVEKPFGLNITFPFIAGWGYLPPCCSSRTPSFWLWAAQAGLC